MPEDDARDISYSVTRDGDGTVPVASAAPLRRLAWYVGCLHSELPRDARVIAATASLLQTGRCTLDQDTPVPDECVPRRIREADLRRTCLPKLDWSAMSPEARRGFLDDLNAPLLPPAS